jgi:hypothetical protein
MTAETNAQLQELLDERQIRSLAYRYCRAIDRRQYDLLRSCYHSDATDHHGDFYGSAEEFVEHCRQALDSFDRTLHFIGNLEIEVHGDTARSEAYVLALARVAASDGKCERDNTVALRYIDDLERRDGEWRILRRVCVYEWTRTDDVPDGWSLPGNFARGRRDATDLIFADRLPAPSDVPVPMPRLI